MLRQPLQFLVEYLQALLGNIIRLNIVDADLQVIETCAVQLPYALRREQIAIGDQGGNHAVMPDAPDDVVQLRVEQRFAAADGNDGGAEFMEAVHPPQHEFERHRFGEVVELIAISAGEIASARRNDVRHDGVAAGMQSLGYNVRLPQMPRQRSQLTFGRCGVHFKSEISSIVSAPEKPRPTPPCPVRYHETRISGSRAGLNGAPS